MYAGRNLTTTDIFWHNLTANEDSYASVYTPGERLVLSMSLVAIMTCSLFGNICIVYMLSQKIHTTGNVFIGHLSVLCLLITVTCMPFSMLSVAAGRWPFASGPVCQASAFTVSVLLLATLFTHTVIGVEKYFAVVKTSHRLISLRKSLKVIALVWLVAVSLSLLPLFKRHWFAYNRTTCICGMRFPQQKSAADSVYLAVLGIVGFMLPNGAIFYLYVRILKQLQTHAKLLRKLKMSSNRTIHQKQLFVTVALNFFFFLTCWSPFFSLVVFGLRVRSVTLIPRGLGVGAYWCGYLYTALNPLVLYASCKKYRTGFNEMKCRLKESIRKLKAFSPVSRRKRTNESRLYVISS